VAGVLAEQIGWADFFLVSLVFAVPALILLWTQRAPIRRLDAPAGAAAFDD
jgi:hypothetical protein